MTPRFFLAAIAGLGVTALAIIVASAGPSPGPTRSATIDPSPPRPLRSASRPVSSAAPPPSALSRPTVAAELHVPRARGPIVPDGELEEAAWQGPLGRTGAFTTPDGAQARPYSDARLLWGDGRLHVVLYAADEDIHAPKPGGPLGRDDTFRLVFDDGGTARSLVVTPLGTFAEGSRPSVGPASRPFDEPWKSGAKAGHDLDGTPDHPDDQDEEWVIEVDIPLASLGFQGKPGEHIGFSVERCDTPKSSALVCAGWGQSPRGSLVLD